MLLLFDSFTGFYVQHKWYGKGRLNSEENVPNIRRDKPGISDSYRMQRYCSVTIAGSFLLPAALILPGPKIFCPSQKPFIACDSH
jgi:hypothetical protein